MKTKRVVICLILLSLLATGCDSEKNKDEKNELNREINDSMVKVSGGRYQMGDFGTLIDERLPLTPDLDNKHLHWVELSDFKITKNRITWGEFNQWLLISRRGVNKYYNKISSRKIEGKYDERMRKYIGDNYPAVSNWKDASDFCHWVGTVSGKNISLPTEAQWEYAARSRGQFRKFANADNAYNLSTPDNELNFTFDRAPVGSYPPNPLGLYDMMGNGHDWVIDWYAEDYYENSPEKNPQGPVNGTEKVVRGYLGSMFGLYDVTRGRNKSETEAPGYGFRCVENVPFK